MKLKISFLLALTFFIMGVFTLPGYGINWDTINHLPRGQAYLHYFLTGRKDYSDLPPYLTNKQWASRWYWQKPQSLGIDTNIPNNQIPRRSMYQDDATTFEYFMKIDGDGHPPLSDILSSVFNLVLFQKMGITNDIDSYRVYGVFLSAVLIGLIFWWVSTVYNKLAGFIAALSLSLYPLFWSESHFNTEKDIPETAYWTFLLFTFWQGIRKKSWRWMITSGIFFGLALGTKFNVLFIIFVILPWIAATIFNQIKRSFSMKMFIHKKWKIIVATIFVPIIGFIIFLCTWPYLWADPLAHIGKVVKFYKGIGLTQNIDENFLGPFGINTYPLQWILFTTPVIILIFAFLGTLIATYRIRDEKDKISLLFLLWLLVPIARVSWSGTTIYGGIRQVMEFIPALAIMAGIGGSFIYKIVLSYLPKIKLVKISVALVILLTFTPVVIKLIQIHPNENVYFNFLIGGLKGAKNRDFPSWGNSFGAAYRQGVEWINNHAEKGANVVYAYELIPNVPRIFFRSDLIVQNSSRSGYLRKGEYAISLTYQGTDIRSYYDTYLEKFIKPSYQVVVDGVPILKVWKNDQAHLKAKWEENKIENAIVKKYGWGLRFDLQDVYKISRLEINYDQQNCSKLDSGYTEISKNGSDFVKLPGVLPDAWRISFLKEQPRNGNFNEPFTGEEARYIDLFLSPSDTCLMKIEKFDVFELI